jgi:hypothetical protein
MSEPVAWIDPKELDMDVSTSVTKHKQFNTDIPLYTSPQKYCLSENNEAYEKGFIDGMAKQRDSRVQQMVDGYAQLRELTNEEIMEVANEVFNTYKNWGYYQIDFARAILAKACEK